MKIKKSSLLAGLFATVLALPQGAMAQSEPVIINGMLIDWYVNGRDPVDGSTGWYQQTAGYLDPTLGWVYYNGLFSTGLDASAKDGKPIWPSNFPIRHNAFYGQAGVFTGDAYYTFFEHEADYASSIDSEYGSESWEVIVRKWTWDGISATPNALGDYPFQNVKCEEVGKMYNTPTDLTYDPLYDVVYGIFNTTDGYKLGTIDMETLEVTYISRETLPISGEIRALAINSKGQLYGIDASGNVYRMNKEDGSLTTVGNVGFRSQRRPMSATFDFRTDKLYWLGYLNDGKNSADPSGTNTKETIANGGRDTGFFEVNTETGVATLIGKTDYVDVDLSDMSNPKVNQYGKMEIVGLYVEGSFTKKDIDQNIVWLKTPAQMKVGETAEVTVRVKNIGLNNVRGSKYSVRLYANGQLAGTIDNSGDDVYTVDLKKGASEAYTFSFAAPERPGKLVLYAEVVNDADEQPLNNRTADVTVNVISDQMMPMVELKGEIAGNGLKLTWDAPDGLVTDGAEDYAAFTYDGLGAWTMYDGDKAATQKPNSWNGSVDYPNWNTPKAFIVFDPELGGINLTGSEAMFVPYDGKQYFAAFWSAVRDDSEAGGHQVPVQDYMVSPELNGQAQTVSFWAKGYKGSVDTGYETMANYTEQMRVLYTTGNSLDPTTYTVARDTFAINSEAWTKYSVALPAGAKHFALECVSTEGFVLMVDNITFRVKQPEVTGYNVYKNGVQVGTTLPATTTSYAIRSAADNDQFTVRVVYNGAESAASNAISKPVITGVERTATMAGNGQRLMYDLNGRAVNGHLRPGVYLIQQNGTTRKVVVK